MAGTRQPSERPTMEMVAALAGVSKITVSRALRGSDLVRPEVRERVAQVAKDIGYRVNVAARVGLASLIDARGGVSERRADSLTRAGPADAIDA